MTFQCFPGYKEALNITKKRSERMSSELAAGFATDYFDPEMKRFVSIEEMWVKNTKNVLRCAADVKRRLDDLNLLRESLRETSSVLAVREQHTIRSIQEESDSLCHHIRRREAELISVVTEDCVSQRQNIDDVLQRIEKSIATLRTEVQIMMKHGSSAEGEGGSEHATTGSGSLDLSGSIKQRFAALTLLEKTLHDSCYYSLPETFAYNVIAKALNPEPYLNILRTKTVSLVPSALTVVAKESKFVCPIPADEARRAAHAAVAEHVAGMSVSSSRNIAATESFGALTATPRGTSRYMEALNSDSSMSVGIAHYIATQGGREPFKNPVTEDIIRVTTNVSLHVGALANLFYDRSSWKGATTDGAPPSIRTKNVPNGRIVFDFSDRRRVRLSGYLLQHGHAEEHAALRNWKLEGSNNATDWIVLDIRANCTALGAQPFNEVTFRNNHGMIEIPQGTSSAAKGSSNRAITAASAEDAPAFRYLALEATGENAASLYHIELARIEFFGTVFVG